MSEKNRIYIWDNLKFVLILLVVIGHFADCNILSPSFKSTYLFIYAFHMPIFIFISGLMHKNDNICNKVYMYLCLYFLLKVNHFLVLTILGKNPTFQLLSEGGTPWFLFALAFFVLLSYLLRNVNTKYVLVLSIIAACFVGYDNSIQDFLVLSRVFVFYPFYVMGNLMQEKAVTDINVNKFWKFPAVLILLGWAWLCFQKLDTMYMYRGFFTGRNPFPPKEAYQGWSLLSQKLSIMPDFLLNILQELYCAGFIHRLVCYIISILTASAIIILIPRIKLPVITELGKRTIQVYFWHYSLIYVIQNTFNIELWCSTVKGKIIYMLTAVFLTILLSLKPFGVPLAPVMNIRKQHFYDSEK